MSKATKLEAWRVHCGAIRQVMIDPPSESGRVFMGYMWVPMAEAGYFFTKAEAVAHLKGECERDVARAEKQLRLARARLNSFRKRHPTPSGQER